MENIILLSATLSLLRKAFFLYFFAIVGSYIKIHGATQPLLCVFWGVFIVLTHYR